MAKKNMPQGVIMYGSSIDRFSFERLAAFPTTNNFAGRLIQLTTDGLLYKRNEANTTYDAVGAANGIKADGTVAFTANQSFGGFKATNLGAGTADTDAVNFLQLKQRGIAFADRVYDYNVANYLAAGFNSNLTKPAFSGVPQIGEIILLRNQTDATQNGLFVYSSGSNTIVRHADYPTNVSLNGVLIKITARVGSGSIFNDDLYQIGIYNPAGAVGTQSIFIRKIYGITEIINTDAFISVDYLSTINITLAANNGLANSGDIVDGSLVSQAEIVATVAQSNATQNKVSYVGDGTFLGGVENLPPFNYVGKLIRVKSGTTNANSIWFAQSANVFKKIFPYAVDNTTIEVVADKLQVKDLGITSAKLAGGIPLAKLAVDPLNRGNHTGTQLSATISDFNNSVDARVAAGTVGLYDDRGNYNASVGTFPTTGGSGTAGAINKGDVFFVSVAGTLGGVAYSIGDSFRALIDAPGQTATNWASMKQGSTLSNVIIKATPVQIGNASLTLIPVTHNLNTKNVKAILRKLSNDEIWDIDPLPTTVNAASLDFGAYVPTTNEFEVVFFA
jgi:hypothetical protein